MVRRAALLVGLSLSLALSPAAALAGTHNTLAAFQQNVRADLLLEPFNGAAQNFLDPYPVSGNGYAYTVQASNAGVRRDANGIGALADWVPTEFAFNGRPVTAFAGTVRVFNEGLATSVGGTVTITLSTGEIFPVNVAAGGTFFAITTTQPFTALHIDSPVHSPPSSAATYEWIDDVYVGTSSTAVVPSDQCSDAVTITPITAAQYPFATGGNTAEAISGVCDGAADSGPDVWFRFVSPVFGSVTLTTCGCTYDSILRVFASCPVGGSGAGQIACNDDFCTGGGIGQNRGSQVQFRVEAGEDYLIRISGFGGASGSGNLAFSVVPDCRGDFNHTGGAPSVQDIFDYLAAYFAGCP